jgi:hypothetical protein
VIDPDWVLEDLDPATWRAIGRFFMPSQYIAAAQPGERGLFVLHDDGMLLRVVDDAGRVHTDLVPGRIDDVRALADELLRRGGWDRVHVIDRQHLVSVARAAEAVPRRELTLDAYYHLMYQLVWDGSGGYVTVPPRAATWRGWRYADVLAFVQRLPSPSALGLLVLRDDDVEIGLALGFRDARIVRVTTLEGLPALDKPTVDLATLDAFWDALASVAPPAGALVCSSEAFERIVDSAAFEKAADVLWRLKFGD